jgi:hypothetical protein
MLEARDEHGQESRGEGCSKVGRVYLRAAAALSSSSCVSTTSCSSPISLARTAVKRSAVRKYLDACAQDQNAQVNTMFRTRSVLALAPTVVAFRRLTAAAGQQSAPTCEPVPSQCER